MMHIIKKSLPLQLIFLSLHIGAASQQHSLIARAGLQIMGLAKSDAGHVASMGAGLYAAAKVHGLELRVDALEKKQKAPAADTAILGQAADKKEGKAPETIDTRVDILEGIVVKGKKGKGPADLSLEKRAEDVDRELFFMGDGSSGSAQSYIQKMREDLLNGENQPVLFSAPVNRRKLGKAKPGSIAHLLNTKTDASDTTKFIATLVRNVNSFEQFKALALEKEELVNATEAKKKEKTDKKGKAANTVDSALAAGSDAQSGSAAVAEKKATDL